MDECDIYAKGNTLMKEAVLGVLYNFRVVPQS